MVKTLSAKQIADKWNLPLETVARKIADGVKVEKEHTSSETKASKIARDHLGERPDYYEKLHKMEKTKVSVKENTTVGAVAGLGFTTGTPAINDDNDYVGVNALAYDPLNGAKMEFMKRIHNKLHAKLGFNEYDPTNKDKSNMSLKESNKKNLTELGEYDNKGGTQGAEGLSDPAPRVKNEDWQLKKYKNPEGGMTKAGVMAYRRENPGSKLQTAVTTEPSKLKPGSKAANRRKSFCARMGGVKGPMKDEKGRPTRKALALRKWNCEEEVKNFNEAIDAAHPTNIERPAIYGSQRAGVRKQAPRPTEVSGRATGRLASQGSSVTGKLDVRRAPAPKTPTYSMPSGQRGSMTASPTKFSSSYSQGGVNVGKAMASSKQTSFVTKGMEKAGLEAVKKAAPAVAAGARAMSGAAGLAAGVAAEYGAKKVAKSYEAGHSRSFKPHDVGGEKYSDVANRMKQKSQGDSIQDYEKKYLTPQKYEQPKAPEAPKVDAPMAPKRPDYFTRGQAFHAARGEAQGGEGKFTYGGSEYQTNVKGEPYSTKLKQTTVTDVKEELKMNTKSLINEAIENILQENLVEMKDNLLTALNEKAMEKLEERKKEIAANYFSE